MNHLIKLSISQQLWSKVVGCVQGLKIVNSVRYNHRIQVFDPSGRFLRAFGSQGSTDGKFNYPWGVATCPLGFIYVCDKGNCIPLNKG